MSTDRFTMNSPHDETAVDETSAATNALSRRDLFSRLGTGVLGAALASLLDDDGVAWAGATSAYSGPHALSARQPHFPPTANAVIHLFMTGGPSQVDLFDPKPALERHAGELPREFLDNVESVGAAGGLLPSPFRFRRYGQSGLPFSEVMPHLAQCADDIAVIHSMWTTSFNHEPGVVQMHTGRTVNAAPTMGSWIVYGLGSESQNLPAYVALDDPDNQILLGKQNWQSGWLPPVYQGTRLRSKGSPLVNLRAEQEYPPAVRSRFRKLLAGTAAAHRDARPGRPELDARIASYELAARMQISATAALDLSRETSATQAMYGLDNPVTESYGRRCLMARRLVERGVRFVQILMNVTGGNNPWDHHGNIEEGLRDCCGQTDQPVAALLKDLKQRGLLERTLVVWGGEFGRLPLTQAGEKPGRDHGPTGFSVWMSGGGVRPGIAYGATDEFGYRAVEDRVSVHDFHATILHCLGLDHERLIYNHHGLDERLSGVEPARVVRGIL